ncbi:bifunctional DNA-formamidopyrimidine glycosylase/DNA-(apurinic or apyrimidinic site) lyase [Marinobacterium arenosum]|uniref:bifunctional DNA-formamidopyrimidine glycosylase/DNA-(apurinic or apyrimidinic site) lyase n=1 Tax=Marinobacterium arenosum TaxID=2862496 RepID=UPI001C95B76F|nr:bifunctional DNA-formamidopyrimidine glycosylase/DNA-(apurinic or apyrimidinic site) lyase [Marinobacterium arenosum]MBY4678839.1 bifunctional DNA-formamidopyrimidine glycosylase/DNA-(apurinic or apyrimidinic site) lyase [Marinobacterium arenosum]
MPELPEVETTRRGVAPHLLGRTVTELVVRQPQLRWPVPTELHDLLPEQPVVAVERRAKYLLIRFERGTLLIHLGMSGSLRIIEADREAGKHDHVDLCLDNGQALRLTDPRRFGAVLWQPADQQHELLAGLGPEPLEDDFNADYLIARCEGRRTAIKTFIMDNRVVVGVGNIYANEALYAAGIHPKRAAGRISRQRLACLVEEIKRVLAQAIKQGGTTLKDFVGSDGKPGYFAQQLNVYGRAGEPCPGCGTALQEIRLGQRSTVFCRHCQR